MKAFLASLAACAVLAVGGNLVLKQMGFSSADDNASQSVRLPE